MSLMFCGDSAAEWIGLAVSSFLFGSILVGSPSSALQCPFGGPDAYGGEYVFDLHDITRGGEWPSQLMGRLDPQPATMFTGEFVLYDAADETNRTIKFLVLEPAVEQP